MQTTISFSKKEVEKILIDHIKEKRIEGFEDAKVEFFYFGLVGAVKGSETILKNVMVTSTTQEKETEE
jgi:hypothetical protein